MEGQERPGPDFVPRVLSWPLVSDTLLPKHRVPAGLSSDVFGLFLIQSYLLKLRFFHRPLYIGCKFKAENSGEKNMRPREVELCVAEPEAE